MRKFLGWLDDLGGIETENFSAKLLDRAAFIFMILMFVSAPHSIAATQISWLTGMFIWVVRLVFLKPRPRLVRTPLDVPLWIFFGWSIVTSIFSYDPPTSLDRLRNVALFLIFYYVVNVVKTKRAAVFLASAMILSCMVSVVWTPIERIFGRGVEISGASKESPLTKAGLLDGDTLLKVGTRKIKTPDDLAAEIQTHDVTKLTFYRPDFYLTVDVPRENLLGGANSLDQLGIAGWKPSRNWRSAGFYGHYTTFAEVLQLIASLTFGLFIASLIQNFSVRRQANGKDESPAKNSKRNTLILAVCVAAMALALLLTVTRASQLGFLISTLAIVLLTGNRKILLTLALIILPVALGGLFFLQQSRQVGFFDPNDDSTKDRQTFYRKGFDLWTRNARHFTLGVGMDATQKYTQEWNLYDNGGKPMGHFHSTPLQLLVERGLPALLLWLWVLWIYGRTLFRVQSSRFKVQSSKFKVQGLENQNRKSDDWRGQGIILGSFGGMIGFFAGGMVHYNLGDAEVAMVFFMLMGLSVGIANSRFQIPD